VNRADRNQDSPTVLVVQGDALNRSRIATAVCVALTSNVKWASAPGNVLLSESATGLPKESVANVSQIVTLDKSELTVRVGKLPKAKLELVLSEWMWFSDGKPPRTGRCSARRQCKQKGTATKIRNCRSRGFVQQAVAAPSRSADRQCSASSRTARDGSRAVDPGVWG